MRFPANFQPNPIKSLLPVSAARLRNLCNVERSCALGVLERIFERLRGAPKERDQIPDFL
jgi:hypothetical protein